MQSTQPNPRPPAPRRAPSPALVDRLVCASAALLAFAVYLVCVPPSVTGEDSGELVAAADTLGIPHPPGYPLWTPIAYAATYLLPFGSVAWRAGAVSALFGALTVWLVAELALHLFRRRDVAWLTGVVLALSREFWEQSTVAEVYTLNTFLVLVSLVLLIAWNRSRRRGLFYAAASFSGLAAAHYALNLLLIPLIFAYVFACDLSPRRLRMYAVAALFTLPGWLIYLYLPLRALADPPMNWGDPHTPWRFWDTVSRGQYAHLLSATPRTWANFADQSEVFGRILANQFTPWVGAIAIPGLFAFWRRDASLAALFTGAFALLALGAIVVPNFPLEYHWVWVNTPYWLPAFVLAACFVGAGFDWLLRHVDRPRNVPAIAAAMAIASLAIWNGPRSFRHGDTIVSDYAADLMDTFAQDAVYFGGGDHTVFPLVYLQIVEGRRPDVLIANRYGYPGRELYELAGENPPSTRPPESEEDRLFARVLELDRPVYSATPRMSLSRQRVNEGLIYRYVRAGESYRTDPVWPEYHWPAVANARTWHDWSNELVTHDYLAARGRLLLDSGESIAAGNQLRRAASMIHGDKSALNNLGLTFAEYGLTQDAAEFFTRAIESDPGFAPALINLARCRIESGDPGSALGLLDRALAAGSDAQIVAQMRSAALRGS